MTSPPTILTNGATNTDGGTACMSNSAGSILLYTDGQTIWNGSNLVMANGFGLLGTAGSGETQRALILKQPGNSNIYYVFTLQNIPGGTATAYLHYSIVDMNLASGQGSVTVKNTLLYNATCNKMTAARHCNGSDIWIVTHDNSGNTFRSFLLTSSGVSPVGTTSGAGTSLGTPPVQFQGLLKISPNSKKLAMANLSHIGTPLFELFDFDNSTGLISNPMILAFGTYSLGTNAEGCEFSADGSKLYGAFHQAQGNCPIFQWDLCAGSNNAIFSSLYTITVTAAPALLEAGNLQLASDGKIYVARMINLSPYYLQTLGVINNPGVSGVGCNYVHLGQSISPKSCGCGLPSFMSSYFITRQTPAPFIYSVNQSTNCRMTSFLAAPVTTTAYGCAASGYTYTGLEWLFGDPASGSANTSTLTNPTHLYPSYGTYSAMLVLHYTCGGGTDTIKQLINVSGPPISIVNSPSLAICPGTTATLTGSGALTYTWYPGGFIGPTYTVNPSASTTYTVLGLVNTCSSTSTATVIVKPAPSLSFLTQSITCATLGSATVNATGGTGPFSYTWMPTAQTGSAASGLNPGNYSITVLDIGQNCVHTATTSFIPLIPLTGTVTSTPSLLCFGALTGTASIATSGGTGNQTYTWSTTTGTQNTSGANSLGGGTHTVTVKDAVTQCSATYTFIIAQPSAMTLSIVPPTPTACAGTNLVMTSNNSGGTPGYTYSWAGGPASANYTVSQAVGDKTYTLNSIDANGCKITSTVLASVIPLPTVTANTPITCPGFPATLIATANPSAGTSFYWPTGSVSSASFVVSPLSTSNFSVIANHKGCSGTGNGTITVGGLMAPITKFSYNSPFCKNDKDPLPVLMSEFTSGGIYSSSGNVEISATSGLVKLSVSGPGTYTILYTVAQQSCVSEGSGTTTIIINETPLLNLKPKLIIGPGSSIVLQPGGNYSYSWSPSAGLSCTNCEQPVASPPENIRYCVTASNEYGCSEKRCVDIEVTCDGGHNFSIPNAFSPNGDGENDLFCLQGWDLCISQFSVLIFDRWGEKVYESTNPNFCWDGIYKGQYLSTEVYVYVINASYTNNAVVKRKGNITLIR